MAIDSRNISLADVTDPKVVRDIVAGLSAEAEGLGMTVSGFTPTRTTNALCQTANLVVRRLDEAMPNMTASEAFSILPCYEEAYRIAYRAIPDRKKINRYVLAAFESMIKGDKDVDEYAMYRTIDQAIRRRDKAFFGRPLEWLAISLDRWYREAKRGYAALATYDLSNRIDILLSSDLYVFEGSNQSAFKSRLRTLTPHP